MNLLWSPSRMPGNLSSGLGSLFSILVYGLVLLSARLGSFASDWLPFSTAFVVGVLATVANLWGRKTGRPSSIVLIPAIVLLVSGSIGFRGLVTMAAGEMMLGAQEFLQMFVVAVTIIVGIMIGYTITRPEPGL